MLPGWAFFLLPLLILTRIILFIYFQLDLVVCVGVSRSRSIGSDTWETRGFIPKNEFKGDQ